MSLSNEDEDIFSIMPRVRHWLMAYGNELAHFMFTWLLFHSTASINLYMMI